MSSRFSLPKCIDDGTIFVADVFVIPQPSLGIYWFSNRSQNSKRIQTVPLREKYKEYNVMQKRTK